MHDPTQFFLLHLIPKFIDTIANVFWWNDLGVTGPNELYVTQFGGVGIDNDIKGYLWYCTWDENDKESNGRVKGNCVHAQEEGTGESIQCVVSDLYDGGFNGMNVNPEGTKLWANCLGLSEIYVYDVKANGVVKRTGSIKLYEGDTVPEDRVIIDNIEYDQASGDLQLGYAGVFKWNGVDTSAGIWSLLVNGGEYPGGMMVVKNGTDTAVSTKTTSFGPISIAIQNGGYSLIGSYATFGVEVCKAATPPPPPLLPGRCQT